MHKSIQYGIESLCRAWGIYVHRPAKNRQHFFNAFNIQFVLDVGANVGQYANLIRKNGYTGRIFSFEPVNDLYEKLKKRTQKDPLWECYPWALGEMDTTSTIHISEDWGSNSLRSPQPIALQAEPSIRTIQTQSVEVRSLATVLQQLLPEPYTQADPPTGYLKLDTQGFEYRILSANPTELNHFALIELESSTIPLYDGETPLSGLLPWLTQQGFTPIYITPGLVNPHSQQMMQVDIILAQTRLLEGTVSASEAKTLSALPV